MSDAQLYDIVLYGASGFTGSLVAKQLAELSSERPIRWALAGRRADKLHHLRTGLPGNSEPDLVLADASRPQTLRAMCARTRLVISTVGPYQQYGTELIEACIEHGTDYVDLCGEVAWMSQMIERFDHAALEAGSRLVFSCGFDSLPFELGVMQLQQNAIDLTGSPLRRVRCRVMSSSGSLSGGSIASGIATHMAARKDADYARRLDNPHSLIPGQSGPPQPALDRVYFDTRIEQWVTPFVMAPINTKNIHRSNFLQHYRYGRDFCYDEMEATGPGEAGQRRAEKKARQARLTDRLLGIAPLRALVQRLFLPKPGDGPDEVTMASGHFHLLFTGTTDDGAQLKVSLTGSQDPGYLAASRMIAQSALCLAMDFRSTLAVAGGFWTPAAAMGNTLSQQLQDRGVLSITSEAVDTNAGQTTRESEPASTSPLNQGDHYLRSEIT